MEKKNTFIKNLVERMTLEQKIGAVLTLGFAGTVPGKHIFRYIEEYHCGGLRLSCDMRQFGSYVDPNGNKTVVKLENANGIRFKGPAPVPTAGQYKAVLDELQDCARRRPCSIPLHFSYDQEGGSSADFFFGGVNLFPKPMGIRATDDPRMAYRIARAVARQGKAAGFNWVHSPVLDVNSHPANPEIYTRAYSDDAAEVTRYARQTCRGLKDGRMIATGKHFPGRGHSDVDAHFQVPVIDVDEKTLWERELLPYRELVAEGLLPSIMIAHSIFPAIDPDHIATVSGKVITGLLREKLGFEGVITTDSMTMGAIATRYGVANACALSLEAGADLVLMKAENHLVEEVVETVRSFIQEGRISMEDMDDKVYRILELKYEYGLFGTEEDAGTADCPELVLQDPGIRRLAGQAARRSILVERDRGKAIPIQGKRILIIEQKVKEYNDMQWHSGILHEACLRHREDVEYLETSYSYDDTDREQVVRALDSGNYETVIATNYFLRGKARNTGFWEEQLERHPGGQVILVTNTPYEELSIPKNAGTVLVTFATSPENIKAAAAVLFGDMVPEGVWPLENRKPGRDRKDFLVCIDSDGCAMDTMTVKHTRCFGPCLVETWGIQQEAAWVLQRWNETNLYTKSRGINRFKGLVGMLGELQEKGIRTEGLAELQEWVENSPELSEAALERRLGGGSVSPALEKALEWSRRVNRAIDSLGRQEKQPFPGVARALEAMGAYADIAILSSANREAVEEEWKEGGLMGQVDHVYAQDQGSKEACLGRLLGMGYRPERVLVVGDAPGDLRAAEGAGVGFYPVVPGREAASWETLRQEAFPCFLAQKDWKEYEQGKKKDYLESLEGKEKQGAGM